MARLKNALYTKIGSRMPADTLTELIKYSSKRYADFMRENSKIICIVISSIYSKRKYLKKTFH